MAQPQQQPLQQTLKQHVYNEFDRFMNHFTSLPKEQYFQDWMNCHKDKCVYAVVCALGFVPVSTDNIVTKQSSANCVHAIIPWSNVHIKMVPDSSHSVDDIAIDAIVGKMITVLTASHQTYTQFVNNFLKYRCSAYMYINPHNMMIPYKRTFDTSNRCESLLYDVISSQTSSQQPQQQSSNEIFDNSQMVYTKCIVNNVLDGSSLDDLINNSSDTTFSAFLNSECNLQYSFDTFFDMCQGMYNLGDEFQFVHNDAHTNNVLYDKITESFTLIDYGRCFIDTQYAQHIVNQENIKHQRMPQFNPFNAWPHIKPEKTPHNNNNIASWLPVMNDIACLSYNIWKRGSGIQIAGTNIINNIMSFNPLTREWTLKTFTSSTLIDMLNQISSNNLRVVFIGLLWMRVYITTILGKIFSGQHTIPLDLIEGTSTNPDRMLWHAGQIRTNFYNLSKYAMNIMIQTTNIPMWDLIKAVFDTSVNMSPGGGGGSKKQKGCEIDEDFEEMLQRLTKAFEQTGGRCKPRKQRTCKYENTRTILDDKKPLTTLYEQNVCASDKIDINTFFASNKSPLAPDNSRKMTDASTALMLNQYTSYYQYSNRYADECYNRYCQETGRYA